MGSAVSHLVGGAIGGGGGGLLGTIGGIAGTAFGGPIGGAIGSAIGNAMNGAVGGAVKDATKTLQQEHGMPKFLADTVHKMVGDVLGPLMKQVDPQVQHAVNNGADFNKFRDDLSKSIIDQVLKFVKGDGTEEGGGAKGGGKSGGSWMQAIAKAMGSAIGEKASRMVNLSTQIQDLTKGATDKSKLPEGMNQEQAAGKAQTLNTEFQATSQEFNLLQTTFSTAIKTLGEGMKSIASKQ